jgi:hypothetical protein
MAVQRSPRRSDSLKHERQNRGSSAAAEILTGLMAIARWQAVEVVLLQIEAGCRPVNQQFPVGLRQPTLCKAGASSHCQHFAFGAKQTRFNGNWA